MSAIKTRFLLPLSLLLAVGVSLLVPRPTRDAYERASGFSVERALMHVRAIAERPHAVGSVAHDEVRAYLLRTLRSLPVELSEQRAVISTHLVGSTTGAQITNVLCRIRGREPQQQAIVLAAHYDSVPSGPGASDDAAAVAAMLETARLLTAGPQLRRDVVLLFTDGEEFGLLGAEAFVREPALVNDVGLVLNFEARGTRGPLLLFQTSGHNAELIRQFARSVRFPNANSLFTTLSRLLPNDTDVTAFDKRVSQVLGFALAEGLEHYHGPTDDAEHLDPSSLAQIGATTVQLARHFGELEALHPASSNAVYFDLWGRWLVEYSTPWAALLGSSCAMFWVWLARRSGRSLRAVVNALGLGAKCFVVTLASGVVVSVSFAAMSAAGSSGDAWIVKAPWAGFAALITVAGLTLRWFLAERYLPSRRELAFGVLGVAAIGALLLGWLAPGMSALWHWSTVAALGAWCWYSRRERAGDNTPRLADLWVFVVPTAITGLLAAPVVAMAFRVAGPTLTAVPLLIGAMQWILLLALWTPTFERSWRPLSHGLSLLGVAVLGVSLVSGKGLSEANRTTASPSEANRTTASPSEATRTTASPSEATSFATVDTRRLAEDEQGRTVELRITAAPTARCIHLQQTTGPLVTTLSVDGRPVTQFVRFSPAVDDWGFRLLTGDRSPRGYRFAYCASERDPLILILQVAGSGPVELDFNQEFDETRGHGDQRAAVQTDTAEALRRAIATPRRIIL